MALVPLPARTTPPAADKIREVFLSATTLDLEAPRTEVQEALRLVCANVFLQEEWAQPAVNALDLSLIRLAKTDAYLGIFGYRYGWVPPGRDRSVTELECDEALRRWGNETVPPIFWFMPDGQSTFAGELEEAAKRVLAKEFRTNKAKQADSLQKQLAFLGRLRDSGRFVTEFSTLKDLCLRANAAVQNWNVEILERAAAGPTPIIRDIPSFELGQIGRDAQREAVEAALLAVDESGEPGVCLVVHGPEDAGQRAFLSFLEQWNPWGISASPRDIAPSFEVISAASLTAAALAAIAPGKKRSNATVDDLAADILERSRMEPVVMFLPLARLTGGLETLHTEFWTPLVAAARTRRRAMPQSSPPFVLVVEVLEPLANPLPSFVADAGSDAPTFDRVLALPLLDVLTVPQIMRWLADLGVRDLKDRKRIADRVVGDGRPRGVFDRLNSEGFWSTLIR